jgi:DNA polymerase I-like protein with 3'-5' exonuclease and polymerase domains
MSMRGVKVNTVRKTETLMRVTRELKAAILNVQAFEQVKALWDGAELETGPCPKGGLTKSGKQQLHKWPLLKPKPKHPPRDMVCERCGVSRWKPVEFSPTSSHQCHRLFYELLKVQKVIGKTGTPTTDDEALVKIGLRNKAHYLLCAAMREVRDLAKQKGFLSATLTSDGRYPSSFNVGAAWTSRWSSSKNCFNEGGNLQNIGEQHRSMFEADEGYRMFYADLKTAESLLVAHLYGDENYIEAHKGDVHTYVTREIWPDLPWTGDIKLDKKIAQSSNPPWDLAAGHDYRFQSKRVQHGSNYGLSPVGMAMIAHIPIKAAAYAQGQFFSAFPKIREGQKIIGQRVENQLGIENPLGRVVRLFGRPWDGHTYKQGLAFPAQSGVADILDLALWQVWDQCDAVDKQLIQCLAQVHDAILGQFPKDAEKEAVKALFRLMRIPVPITDLWGTTRTCTIEVEVAVGGNWGKRNLDEKKGPLNPDGLEEVKEPT